MNTAAKLPDYYTMEDIYNLPDGQRAELIDGNLYMMAAPGRIHQELVTEVTYLIKDKIVKFLCKKGMLDPVDDNAVEVEGARRWM